MDESESDPREGEPLSPEESARLTPKLRENQKASPEAERDLIKQELDAVAERVIEIINEHDKKMPPSVSLDPTELGSSTLIRRMLIMKHLTTEGFDGELNASLSASLNFGAEDVEVVFPTKKKVVIPKADFHGICLAVLSNTSALWLKMIDPNFTPPHYDAYLQHKSTPALMLMGAAFHLAHELQKAGEKTPAVSGTPAMLENMFGKKFHDLLPPRNFLAVPSKGLQDRIRKEDQLGKLIALERLQRCHIEFQSGQAASFFFRPYNTPILGLWKLGEVQVLNSALKDEYESLQEVQAL